MTAYQIISTILMIAFGALSYYFKYKTNLQATIAGHISNAENEYQSATKSGGEKFQFVVDSIYKVVPTIFKPFITKDMIGILVQKTFDEMAIYATKQLDIMIDKITNNEIEG